ncbi:MAG: GNAT family N-acetyltransferase [Methylocystaceae bacterium]|nr:GNAT family N-acetyltransferase [Methylocystaceae bacterium]
MTVSFRKATKNDLPFIVQLLAQDELGQGREDASLPLADDYIGAFDAIEADPNQLLCVCLEGGKVIGSLQISFIPGLSRKGMWRGQIEAVRIATNYRNEGLGEKMFSWAIEQCKDRNCQLVQLTTDKSRPDAHRFYDGLGFVASHEGYKLAL